MADRVESHVEVIESVDIERVQHEGSTTNNDTSSSHNDNKKRPHQEIEQSDSDAQQQHQQGSLDAGPSDAASQHGPSSAANVTVQSRIVEVMLDLRYKWSGTIYDISVAESDTVGDLKALIFSQTTIPVERQKILGLVKGKLPDDEVALVELQIAARAGKEFTVLGTPIGKELQASLYVGPSDGTDEKDVDPLRALRMDDPAMQRRNARKLLEASNKLQINIMNEPRPGKKLLVLDLDYTILDTHAWKSQSFHAIDYMRPGMHDFLEVVYPHYDIVIWSQTSWMWLESKLIELGMVGEEQQRYKISFVLDRGPMFSVYSVRNGKAFKHEVKALEIIWKKFPAFYGAENSIHIDDLGRNFVLNPQQGLKISAYKDALKARHTDRELFELSKYLVQIAKLDSFTALDHSKWKSYGNE